MAKGVGTAASVEVLMEEVPGFPESFDASAGASSLQFGRVQEVSIMH